MDGRARADDRRPRRRSARAVAPGQLLVGFAADHGERGLERAREKLADKKADLFVFNDVARTDIGFDSADNEVTLVVGGGERAVAEGAEGRDRGGGPRRGGAAAWLSRRSTPAPADLVGGDRREPRPGRARARRDAAARRPLPRRRGAPDHRGLPRRREDDAREGARALARLLVLAAAVHARPAAVRRHRRQRLRPAGERVRVPAGPGLREPPARRRGQPRLAEDPGGAARVHAGEPGHGRRRHLPARARRSW